MCVCVYVCATQSFFIGGADGLPAELKADRSRLLSLSKLTFTHQMARLLLVTRSFSEAPSLPDAAVELTAPLRPGRYRLFFRLVVGAGALLLRGWSVDSEEDFERAMARLPLRPIADYFPAEPGRRPPAAAGKCWQTNSLKSTGGYIGGEVLPHSECYYALEPPTYAAFCCLRAPWLGGQTALFDGAGALASLPMATSGPGKRYWEHEEERNFVTTRILWLRGLIPGHNAGPGCDSHDRYIYIHGTNLEPDFDNAKSHGCVILRNDDVIKLFDAVPSGTRVLIE